MKRYNLKKFFKERLVQDGELVSNGHFGFDKKILTTKQKEMLDKLDGGADFVCRLRDILEEAEKWFDIECRIGKDKYKFNPDYVKESTNGMVVHDKKLGVTLNMEYYHFFTVKKCDLYFGKDIHNPLAIARDGEFIGVLFPVRLAEGETFAMTYEEYINSK